MKKRMKSAVPQPPPYPRVYYRIGEPFFDKTQFSKDDQAYCFNGDVGVERYRVTIEKIEEPVEVVRERLRKLWLECDNHHSFGPIRATAKRFGLELEGHDFGRERKR